MRNTVLFSIVALGAALTAGAQQKKLIELPADNPMATLKAGAGMEVTRGNCSICHSTDYVVRQPRGDAAHWRPEVEKMIKVYGAPVSEEDAKTIVDYLATAYSSKTADSAHAPGPRRH